MMAQVLAVTIGGFAVGTAGMALANRRARSDVARARWLKLASYFVIVHVVLAACAAGRIATTALVAMIAAASARELWHAWRRIPAPRPAGVWPVFGLSIASLAAAAWRLPGGHVAFIFLVVATFDGFSQVGGQVLGRRKLVPHISPNKTVEGLAIGAFAALIVARASRDLLPADGGLPLGLGAAVAACAFGGDLAASWVKRRAGVKDYSSALPGQGGVLDRFNSFMAAMTGVGLPMAWLH